MGEFKDLTSGECEYHARLLRQYIPSFGNLVDSDFDYETSSVFIQRSYNHGANFLYSNRGWGTSSKAFALLSSNGQPQIGRGRLHNPSWIDINLLGQWMANCEASHTECTKSIVQMTMLKTPPSFLIDLESCCLVEGSIDMEYWALSYVWGGVTQSLNSKATVNELCLPGALEQDGVQSKLPATIRHAFALTKRLGIRYIWVDSLCIIQDADHLKALEISKMSSIFGGASVTIVAANGFDANHGLLGLSGISGPRDRPQDCFPLKNEARIIDLHQPSQDTRTLRVSSLAKWKSRGWTFQESFFSRRKLIFYDDYVGWECCNGCNLEFMDWENTNAMPAVSIEHAEYVTPTFRREKLSTRQMIDMDSLSLIIGDFNQRHFTYPEDALDAFSGFASFMHARSMKTLGFISGLPRPFFHLALLWHDDSCSPRSPSKRAQNTCLPTWSWVGWRGASPGLHWKQFISFQGSFQGSGQYPPVSWNDRASSSVQWTGHQSKHDAGIIIPDEWAQIRDLFVDSFANPAPEGWTRITIPQVQESEHDSEPSTSSCPDRAHGESGSNYAAFQPRCLYSRESEPNETYRVPLQFPEVSEERKSLQIPLISCVTVRAYLELGEGVGEDSRSTNKLHDKNGELVGALDVRRVLTDAGFGVSPLPGATVELVEIARGVKVLDRLNDEARWVFEELQQEDWPTLGSTYEYVWVLGIRWEKDIAYRESIGRIMKIKWDKMDKDEIKLMLG